MHGLIVLYILVGILFIMIVVMSMLVLAVFLLVRHMQRNMIKSHPQMVEVTEMKDFGFNITYIEENSDVPSYDDNAQFAKQ